ncbi:MAG TPA: hypothetical protein VGF55_21975 [Gemmataceae bacterium]|jgi:hypothetical protein
MSESQVNVSLTKAEAIVLVEFLLRFRDQDRLTIEHEGERQSLWDLCCVVERQIPELFDPQWKVLVEQARIAIVADSAS